MPVQGNGVGIQCRHLILRPPPCRVCEGQRIVAALSLCLEKTRLPLGNKGVKPRGLGQGPRNGPARPNPLGGGPCLQRTPARHVTNITRPIPSGDSVILLKDAGLGGQGLPPDPAPRIRSGGLGQHPDPTTSDTTGRE